MYRLLRIGVTGSEASALGHAQQVIRIERALGLFHEGGVYRAVARHPSLARLLDFYYGNIHFVVPAVVLLVLFLRRRDRYERWRNIFGWMLGIGLVVFALYAVMPGHLLPQSLHFGNPVEPPLPKVSPFSWNADNPYAAMPSLHVGWATWCTLALWPAVRNPVARVALVAYPFVTVFVVVATANHYVLDAVGGWVTLAGAYGLEELRLRVYQRSRWTTSSNGRRFGRAMGLSGRSAG